jgi:hypothetical protein
LDDFGQVDAQSPQFLAGFLGVSAAGGGVAALPVLDGRRGPLEEDRGGPAVKPPTAD